ncbi:hypothetical protein PCYB_007220, partial [Plasmodium cynomolgi strain B]
MLTLVQDKNSVKENKNNTNSIDTIINDSFIELCEIIKAYLSHSDIKSLKDVTNSCKYINYHIRKDPIIKQKYYDKNGTFNDLMICFPYDDEIKNNSCISKMKYIEDIAFDEMHKLYELYENYEAFCYERNI